MTGSRCPCERLLTCAASPSSSSTWSDETNSMESPLLLLLTFSLWSPGKLNSILTALFSPPLFTNIHLQVCSSLKHEVNVFYFQNFSFGSWYMSIHTTECSDSKTRQIHFERQKVNNCKDNWLENCIANQFFFHNIQQYWSQSSNFGITFICSQNLFDWIDTPKSDPRSEKNTTLQNWNNWKVSVWCWSTNLHFALQMLQLKYALNHIITHILLFLDWRRAALWICCFLHL